MAKLVTPSGTPFHRLLHTVMSAQQLLQTAASHETFSLKSLPTVFASC
jgi:hypothetical protein